MSGTFSWGGLHERSSAVPHASGRLGIGHGAGKGLQGRERVRWLEQRLEFADGLKLLPRGHDEPGRIGLADLALGVGGLLGKVAGPMEVEVGVERFGVKAIDVRGMLLGDMAVAHELAHHGTVLGLGQGIVVGLTGRERVNSTLSLFRSLAASWLRCSEPASE